ncbi:MAG: hypothetical protein IJS12_09630 [Lachnospiraceae bacterium]|nr:hypothetical protein [Lachnospiraceae bacterium]
MTSGNKKRKNRRSPIGYIVVIVIMATLLSLLVYEHYHPIRKLPAGTWIREHDLSAVTDQAIHEWLHSAETGLTELPEADHDTVTVNVILRIDADGGYSQQLDTASYEAAAECAYRNLEKSLRSVISARFTALGMTDESGLPDADIDMLMRDAVGMSMDEYLHKAVPDIMPSQEELADVLDRSGFCRIDGDLISFDNDAGQVFLSDSGRLLIGDELYTEVRDEQ